MPYSQPTVENLRGDIQHYISLSIASSTKQTYSAGEKRYIDFVTRFKQQSLEQCLPATEAILTEFVAFLAKSIKYASIKTYLAAVRHLHMRRGLQLNLPKMQQLQLVLRGIKRSHGDQSRVRLPITIHHLRLFHLMLAIPSTQNYESLMIWAAMTLAFFGFLRLGELTCNTKFNPEVHLMLENLYFAPGVGHGNPEFMTVEIKVSKTDPFRSGQTITVGASNSPLCPVLAMKKYLVVRKTTGGPLFVHVSGKPLTKQTLTAETRILLNQAGFNASHYAGHSYRIGAATTAASANLPAWLIKTLGRWSSDCYERYIRIPSFTLSKVSATMTASFI